VTAAGKTNTVPDTSKIKRYIALALQIAGAFLLLAAAAVFFLRSYFLEKAIERVAARFMRSYKIELKVESGTFHGFSEVELRNVSLVPLGKDTLLHVDHFTASIRLWYALFGDVRAESVSLHGGYLQVINRNGYKNYDNFFLPAEDSIEVMNSTEEAEEVNYAELLYRFISRVLNHLPATLSVENFMLKGTDEEYQFAFNVKQMTLHDKHFHARIGVSSTAVNQNWLIDGFANPAGHRANLHFYNLDTGKVMIPYISEMLHIRAGFDSVRFELDDISLEDDQLKISGYTAVKSFMVTHPKISSQEVVIDDVEFYYNYLIGKNFISLDSTSTVKFNKVTFHPFIKFENSPDTVYYLGILTDKTQAQDFITSLPEGLFSHVKGMETTGSFTYRLNFRYNENHPDEMIFESSLDKENFRITRFGSADLAKLNGDFVYVPKENGRAQRAIVVGPSNPNYTPIDQVSPYLKKCVLTTEDPSFYYHRGFVTEAFRQSIVKNIRTGKFKRGASTISMQLVKNVFLTREKTVARKLEEILLVYILENNYLVPKERMFEVYLNIIEWGPNIYGIGEASRFYFRKKPADLTLSESLFLATIIPRPKGFMWRFDKGGTPRPYLERTFRFLGGLMVRRNLLTADDTLGLTHLVNIVGAARKFIIRNDSTLNDTILENELHEIVNPHERSED
jgi:hypothetical protein